MNSLSEIENQILSDFKQEIEACYPGVLKEFVVFGSKARGDFRADSDLDVLVVIDCDDWKVKDRIREIGYSLDNVIDNIMSIQVVSSSHVNYLRKNRFNFIENVYRDAVLV